MGIISAKTAFIVYAVLAILAVTTLDGDHRLFALAAVAIFAVKTYIDILRRRIQAREAAEAALASSAPASDVGSGVDS